MVTATAPGEAIITVSHEKANSDLQIFIEVAAPDAKFVKLNQTVINLEKDTTKNTTTIKATIENGEEIDKQRIDWTIAKAGNLEIATIDGGTGSDTATVRALNVGKTTLTASLKDSKGTVTAKAYCDVIVTASALFQVSAVKPKFWDTWSDPTKKYTIQNDDTPWNESTYVQVPPNGECEKFYYKVYPANTNIAWSIAGQDCFVFYGENKKQVEEYIDVNGTPVSSGMVYTYGEVTLKSTQIPPEESSRTATYIGSYKVNNKSVKASVTVRVGWTYSLIVTTPTNRDSINILCDDYDITDESVVINYAVQPENANIHVLCDDNLNEDYFKVSIPPRKSDDGTGQIIITPTHETKQGENLDIVIEARNPDNQNALVAQREIVGSFRYKKHTPVIKITEQQGIYSYYSTDNVNDAADVLHIGDGEKVVLEGTIKEKNTAEKVSSMKYTKAVMSATEAKDIISQQIDGDSLFIHHTKDFVENVFKITKIKLKYILDETGKYIYDNPNEHKWWQYQIYEWDKHDHGDSKYYYASPLQLAKAIFGRGTRANQFETCPGNGPVAITWWTDLGHYYGVFWIKGAWNDYNSTLNNKDEKYNTNYEINYNGTSFKSPSMITKNTTDNKIKSLMPTNYDRITNEAFYYKADILRNIPYFYCVGTNTFTDTDTPITYQDMKTKKGGLKSGIAYNSPYWTLVVPHVMTDLIPDVQYMRRNYSHENENVISTDIGTITIKISNNETVDPKHVSLDKRLCNYTGEEDIIATGEELHNHDKYRLPKYCRDTDDTRLFNDEYENNGDDGDEYYYSTAE